MSVVEQFLLKTEEIDEEFRLWITSEPNNRFPIGLLQVIDTKAPCALLQYSAHPHSSGSLLGLAWHGMAWHCMIGVVCR